MVCSHSFDRIRRLSCYFSVGARPADLRAARFAGPETRIRLRAVAQKGRYMLQLKEIRKEYKTGDLEQVALNDVSLNLRDNEFVAILGPSGSGKTTLLNIIVVEPA